MTFEVFRAGHYHPERVVLRLTLGDQVALSWMAWSGAGEKQIFLSDKAARTVCNERTN